MPNWCQNKLIVRGPFGELARFCAQAALPDGNLARTPPLSLASFVAPPGAGDPGAEWCCEHWGTVDDADFRAPSEQPFAETRTTSFHGLWCREDNGVPCLEYRFETPTAPPLAAVAAMAAQFRCLEFELVYADPWMDLAGRARYAHGLFVDDAAIEVQDVMSDEDEWL